MTFKRVKPCMLLSDFLDRGIETGVHQYRVTGGYYTIETDEFLPDDEYCYFGLRELKALIIEIEELIKNHNEAEPYDSTQEKEGNK